MIDFDNNKLRLIFAGLVLIVLALAFLIFKIRFMTTSQQSATLPPVTQRDTIIPVVTISPTGSAVPTKTAQTTPGIKVATPTPTKASVASNGQNTIKGGQVLPATGFPEIIAGLFAILSMIIGLSLRKFPR